MKNILVPIDFTPGSSNAAIHAAHLADELDAKLTLLHCWHASPTLSDLSHTDALQKFGEDQKTNLKTERNRILKDHPNLEIQTRDYIGFPIPGITQSCQEEKVDLIVIGNNGANGVSALIFGTTTTGLIGEVNVPILAIPCEIEYKPILNVTAAVDLQTPGFSFEFDSLKSFISEIDANLSFLNVYDESVTNNTERQILAERFDDTYNHKYHEFVIQKDEDIVDGIWKGIESRRVDLLTLIAHEHSFWEGFLHRSVCKRVVNRTDVPILIFPGNNVPAPLTEEDIAIKI